MDNLIISVIVPIYNGEKTIARAIESVLCQMDGRIELILVDDGSTDRSGAICDGYAVKYPHIHVIHKSNGGTSSAKNMGIEKAKGMYLSFLDCDDFFDADTFSQIIPILLQHRPDCLDFGWKYVSNQGDISKNLHQCPKNTLISLQELETVILPPLLNLRKDDAHFVYDFCCTKVFKAEIVKQFHVHFDEDKRTWEDRTFLLRHLRHCSNYYAMDKCFYNYVSTPNSLSQRYNLDFFRIIIENFRHYRELFEDRFDFNSQYVNDYWSGAIENMIFRSLKETENQKIIQNNIRDTLRNEQVIYWFVNRTPKKRYQLKVKQFLVEGEYEKALNCFKKHIPKAPSGQRFVGVKRIIKKVIGRK